MTQSTEYLLNRILYIEQKQLEHEKFFARIFSEPNLLSDRPSEKIFFEGEVYGASSFLIDLIASAEQEIILIDAYVTKETLDLLAKKRSGVPVHIFTKAKHPDLSDLDLRRFNSEYPRLELHATKEFHDRFLILDRRTVYHIGASLKDAGKRCFAVTRLEDETSVNSLISCVEMPYNIPEMSTSLLTPSFDYTAFRSELATHSEASIEEFSKKTIPCSRPFLGVRIPVIRRLVSQLSPQDLSSLLAQSPVAFEEVIARGFAISRLPYEEMLVAFDSQLPLLDNWCSVDTFCASLRKVLKGHEGEFYEAKIPALLSSDDEFTVRTGLVLLLDFYVSFDYLGPIFENLEALATRDEYYIKMAMAWLLTECLIKFPADTRHYLELSSLSDWVINKTISKAHDSFRISPATKTELSSLRRF
ncbi:DNA alkylation repair protein [Candidatus Saccharibacteria bacterium]|nr:DNA alkylation repair protein [Candidatus Saccharibacteria bacterium]